MANHVVQATVFSHRSASRFQRKFEIERSSWVAMDAIDVVFSLVNSLVRYYLRLTYSPVNVIEGSLEAKLPTIWRDGNGTARKKLGRGESQKGETRTWRKSEGRR